MESETYSLVKPDGYDPRPGATRDPAGLETKLDALARLLSAQAQPNYGPAPVHPWRPALARIWKMRWIVAGCAVAGLALGVALDAVSAKQFRATGILEMLDRPNLSIQTKTLSTPAPMSAGQEVSWQPKVAVLESDALIKRTVTKLGEDKTLRAVGNAVKPGTPRGNDAGSQKAASVPLEEQATLFRKHLTIKLERGTNLVNISFVSVQPALAAEAVNGLMEEYISFDLDRRISEAQRTKQLLNQQLADAKQRLERSESRLEDYAKSRGVVTLGNNLAGEERVRLVENALASAEANRTAAESRYKSMVDSGATVDPSIEQEQAKLTELNRELASLNEIYTPSHYRIKQLTAEIHQIQDAIAAAQRRTELRSKSDLTTASGNEKLLQNAYKQSLRDLSDQASKAVEYNVRRREVESNRGLYDSILQAVQETNITSALEAPTAGVLESASAPLYPAYPKPGLNPLIGFLAGSILAAAVILFRFFTDRKVRQDQFLSGSGNSKMGAAMPLSLIPAMSRQWNPKALLTRGRTPEKESTVGLAYSPDYEQAGLREAIHSALVSLQLQLTRPGLPRVILVTSPESGEGKSFIASQMAKALLTEGRRVLLIDAALDNPTQHTLFDVSNVEGWWHILREADEVTDRLTLSLPRQTRIDSLHVLPAGRDQGDRKNGELPAAVRPPSSGTVTPLLSAERIGAALRCLKRVYDVIVIDASGVKSDPSVRLWAKMSEAVLLVVKSRETSTDAVSDVLNVFAQDRVENVRTILNGADIKQSTRRRKTVSPATEVVELSPVAYQSQRKFTG